MHAARNNLILVWCCCSVAIIASLFTDRRRAVSDFVQREVQWSIIMGDIDTHIMNLLLQLFK